MRLPTLQLLPSPPRLHRKAWRTAAVAAIACWAASPAAARLQYSANAYIELRVSGAYGNEVERLADPEFAPARTDSSLAHAGREYLISGVDWDGKALVAQARAEADASGDTVRAAFSSNQILSSASPFQSSWSHGNASAYVELLTPVAGPPGMNGTVVISGVFWGGISAPSEDPKGSGASLSGNVSASTFAAGSAGCQQAACGRSDSLWVLLREGATLLGWIDRPWRLELPVVAGQMLQFTGGTSAGGSAGYGGYLSIGAPPRSFASLAAAQAGELVALAEAVPAAAGGLLRIELSPGLELADPQGLVRNSDGSYGLASPVPEPGTWGLWGVAVVLGWVARRRIGLAG
jgi:hypothetical protein